MIYCVLQKRRVGGKINCQFRVLFLMYEITIDRVRVGQEMWLFLFATVSELNF